MDFNFILMLGFLNFFGIYESFLFFIVFLFWNEFNLYILIFKIDNKQQNKKYKKINLISITK